MDIRRCPRCNAEIQPSDALFCSVCGLRLNEAQPMRQGEANVRTGITGKQLVMIVIGIIAAVVVITWYILSVITLSGSYGYGYSDFDNEYKYSVSFEWTGSCVWRQDGLTFTGTYYRCSDGSFMAVFKSNGWSSLIYQETAFNVKKSGKNLIISGGVVSDAEFTPISGSIVS